MLESAKSKSVANDPRIWCWKDIEPPFPNTQVWDACTRIRSHQASPASQRHAYALVQRSVISRQARETERETYNQEIWHTKETQGKRKRGRTRLKDDRPANGWMEREWVQKEIRRERWTLLENPAKTEIGIWNLNLLQYLFSGIIDLRFTCT